MQKSSHHKKQTKNSRWPLAIGIFFFLAFCFLLFIFYKVFTLEKFIYVNRSEVGDAEIIIVDSKTDKFLRYKIPAETEVDASNGYGRYMIKSLWILSEKDEKKGGVVAETIVKNYSLPIYLWKNGKNSNLSFLQNVKIRFTKNFEGIELRSSEYINFSSDYFINSVKSIEVQDMTGEIGVLDKVSKIIETVGGKITLNSKGYDENLDCEIGGSDIKNIELLNKIFNCKVVKPTDNSKDILLKLGAKFAERF